jgi:TonB family protein
MAVVYRAFDAVVGRTLAVKVLRIPSPAAEGEIEEARLRFENEVQTLSRLSPHDNIPVLYHFGEDGEFPYFAMELVPGEALDEKISGGKTLLPDDAIPIIRQIACALDYAHSKGIVHRDIKPGNVLVQPNGRVKIIDFGIARVGSQNLTATGARLGTPAYMSPEQIKGEDVHGLADQFSLAVLAYRALTGRMPFEGKGELEHYNILHSNPPPPSRVNPALSARLDEVLQRALRKAQGDRFETCGEFAAALDKALRGSSKPDPADAPRRTAVSFSWSSRKLKLFLWALSAMAAIAGLATWIRTIERRPPKPIGDFWDQVAATAGKSPAVAPSGDIFDQVARSADPPDAKAQQTKNTPSPPPPGFTLDAPPPNRAGREGSQNVPSARGAQPPPSGDFFDQLAAKLAPSARDGAQAALRSPGSKLASSLASTKTDLQRTKSEIRRVPGDLGITSGYLATNGKEIEELRQRGERTIVEFRLGEKNKKDYQKVGDISLLMKNADPKRNSFTLEVKADDKITEKKNSINVPLQFYVGKSLYELVINTVGKDTVAGYLSTPKMIPPSQSNLNNPPPLPQSNSPNWSDPLAKLGLIPAATVPTAAASGVSDPVVIFKVDPESSEEARKARLTGTVVLSIVVDQTGGASDIHVVKSLGMGLDEKAMEAVQKWKFKPAMKGGHAVNMGATITANFNAPIEATVEVRNASDAAAGSAPSRPSSVISFEPRKVVDAAAEAEHQDRFRGYWIEPGTRMMWSIRDNGIDVNWNQAVSYCKKLSLGGYGDWWLPATNDLARLYDTGQKGNIKGGIQLSMPRVWSATQPESPRAFREYFSFGDGTQNSAKMETHTNFRVVCAHW